MCELLPNMVLSEVPPEGADAGEADPKEWVLLHVDPYDLENPDPEARAYGIERDAPQAVPQEFSVAKLTEEIASSLMELSRRPLLPAAVFAAATPDKPKAQPVAMDQQHAFENAGEKARTKTLEFRQQVIARVRERAPELELFDDAKRAKAISETATEFDIAAKTIRRWLTRWWQAGCKDAALLTRYSECGRKGEDRVSKSRPQRPEDVRPITWLGRTPKYRTPGVVIDHVHFPRLLVAWKTMKKEGWSPADAYYWMLSQFYPNELKPGTDGCPELKQDAKAPTLRQFKYWLEKHESGGQLRDLLGLNRPARRRASRNRKTSRSKKARTGVAGPGEMYEIDATILDVYVVASTDRGKVIGRPVLYVVIDVWSGMVVAAYVTVENASWAAAMGAIDAILEDKVALCSKHGIDITAAMWPNAALPQSFQADNAEVKSRLAARLLTAFSLRIAHHPAYWPEWKAFVERSFRIFNAVFGDYVDGYVDINRERGEPDYRGEAIMTVEEVFGMVLRRLVQYNNSPNNAYIMPPDMVADKVLPVPSAMWAWGIRRRSGLQRHYDRDFVRFTLMPQSRGAMTSHGVLFKGLLYESAALSASGVYTKVGTKRIPVVVTYDPRCMDSILVHDPDARQDSEGYLAVELTSDHDFARGLSLQELAAYNDDVKALRAAAERRKAGIAAVTAGRNYEAVKEARKATAQAGAGSMTTRERTKHMREARAAERQRRAQEQSFTATGSTTPPPATTAPANDTVVDELDIDQVAARHAA